MVAATQKADFQGSHSFAPQRALAGARFRFTSGWREGAGGGTVRRRGPAEAGVLFPLVGLGPFPCIPAKEARDWAD